MPSRTYTGHAAHALLGLERHAHDDMRGPSRGRRGRGREEAEGRGSPSFEGDVKGREGREQHDSVYAEVDDARVWAKVSPRAA